MGLTKVGAWSLRACLYACGGLVLTFMLGFILSPGDLPPDAELGDFIRERITAATSR